MNLLLVLVTIIATLPQVRVSRNQTITEMGLEGIISGVTFERESKYGEVLMRFLRTDAHNAIFFPELILVVLISVDFVVRLIVCPSRKRFCLTLSSFLTLTCLVPTWISLIMMVFLYIVPSQITMLYLQVTQTFWLMRIIRVIAVIQMLISYKSFKVIVLAVKESAHEMLLLGVLICSGAVLFGSLAFLADINEDSLWTIPDGIWWALITMTTVGYGDKYPISVFGKCIGVVCAMTGILIIALPIPIVANNFVQYHGLERYVKGRKDLTKPRIFSESSENVKIEDIEEK